MIDYADLKRDAQDQIDGHEITCDPASVLALIAENEKLREAVKFSVETFSKISSGDGSGHADLSLAVLRIAGSAMSGEQ